MNLLKNPSTSLAGQIVVFLFFFFSSGGHLVQQSGTVWAILVEGYQGNIAVKLVQNMSTGLAEVILIFFNFKPLKPFCSREQNGLRHFGRGSPKEHSCIIISRSLHSLRRKMCLKVFLFLSSGGHLVQRSRAVWAILVEGHLRNMHVKLFQNPSTGLGEEVVQRFLCSQLRRSWGGILVWARPSVHPSVCPLRLLVVVKLENRLS